MLNKKFDEWVTVLENRKVNEKYYKLIFQSKNLAKQVQPGQFLHIQIDPARDFFLRRPFSYYRIVKDRIEILYEVLGSGTAILSEKQKGSSLKVMGPLGRPFTQRLKPKKRILVAGGVGVPPLVFLAERFGADLLVIGTKSKAEVLPKKELSGVKAEIRYSTNDGSYGKKGFVTDILKECLKSEDPDKVFIQTCGPNVMMRAVMKMAREKGIEGEASLDETMGCGVGACLGCMVKTKNGWEASCVEGPVFRFDALAVA